ncbi:hypothetical protein [Crossiella sp. CA198]|uniref:hypothetical protein n=1 Tax=Crossiella sp. CA198 TaxID=3455607 RepID=UPI003F8D1F1D
MVGALDPTPATAGTPGSVYHESGYAGLIWHLHNPQCKAPTSIAGMDTWAGNQLFNTAKVVIGTTNGLHYTLSNQELAKPFDDLITTGTAALYNRVTVPLLGLVLIVSSLILFPLIWRGNLARISRKALMALGGLWLASATFFTPLLYTHVLDRVLITGTSQVQADLLSAVRIEQQHTLPTLLHESVVYRNWVSGQFGSPDSEQAQQYARDLARSQGFTKTEAAAGQVTVAQKKQDYLALRGKIGDSTAYADGGSGARTGYGLLAFLQSVVYGMFQLLVKLGILLAQVILRVVVLAGPVLGLVAIVHHGVLRAVGRAVAAAVFTAILFAVLAGVHTLALNWILETSNGLSAAFEMFLATAVAAVLILAGKPLFRIRQLADLTAEIASTSLPAVRGGFWERLRLPFPHPLALAGGAAIPGMQAAIIPKGPRPETHTFDTSALDDTVVVSHGVTVRAKDGHEKKSGGPVVFKVAPWATPEQIVQYEDYVAVANEALAAGALSRTGRVSTTKNALSLEIETAIYREKERAKAAKTPYKGVAGHGPDASWTGRGEAYKWIDMDSRVNGSLGGQNSRYRIGYKPTVFALQYVSQEQADQAAEYRRRRAEGDPHDA